MSRRGQTNARTSTYSRRVPIRLACSAPLASSLAPDRDDQVRSIDRYVVGGTRKCIPGFLVFPRALRRTAPQLPEITSLSLFLSLSLPAATLIPPPRLSPFFPSSLPLSLVPRAAPHADLLPLSVPVHLFFPLSARLIPLVSFSFPPPARASSPPRHVENPCPTYPPCPTLSLFLLLSSSLFRARVDTVPPSGT